MYQLEVITFLKRSSQGIILIKYKNEMMLKTLSIQKNRVQKTLLFASYLQQKNGTLKSTDYSNVHKIFEA